ncbi:MAG: DUF423 domain-containing protein [Magnetococcales bacterium]|nr:DUF423 domain-containing protein [Magnetococcales bacterium]
MPNHARFLLWGAINAALAVMLGAFGKHALAPLLTEKMMEIWRTGAYYHLVHAVGLMVVAALLERSPHPERVTIAGWLLLTGIVLFCGSLYLLSVTELRTLGMLTPLGGLCFIMGWLWLAASAWPKPTH